MSMTTPPGWYPDPGIPATERWWDGTAWTGHTRPVAAPTAALVPGPGGGPGAGGQGVGRGGIVALVLAGAVLVGAIVTGAVVLGRDDEGTAPRSRSTSTPLPSASPDAKNTTPAAPADDPALLVDQLNGITLPVPDGWEKPESTLDDAPTMVTEVAYRCPGDTGQFCHHGTVSSRTATRTDVTSPEKLAAQDISVAADRAYGEDALGNRIHGGIKSHEQLASKSVVVAGRTGHLVRWRVTTGTGPGGCVQSLVFPSAVGSESLIIVRLAFDAGPDGPPLADMDRIVEGIRPIGDVSGGVGSTVGP
ncbi:DUF2510 domain-containing protein [Streptomyces sp. NPDC059909]|uniref:DUF2510 domain-containing protein n=1 Tax=Streptomyces sp. NPDC059909 TaxID=3346998 RepID=UPI003655F44D